MVTRATLHIIVAAALVTVFACTVCAAGHQGITDCFVCHDFANGHYDDPASGNLRWVPNAIEYPAGDIHEPIAFTVFSWDETWGPIPDGTLADGDDTKLDGPCEVCHTQTAYHTNTGDGTTHFDAENCVVCHPHFPEDGDYFAPQLIGPQSHETHLRAKKGPQITDCLECHDSADFGRFADGKQLAGTTVCDPCHSPGGAYEGVDDEVVGAKPNWEKGIYKTSGDALKKGKDHWCATCHDDGSSVVKGVIAPNVMGDDTTYGYNATGHGRSDVNVQCGDCHTLVSKHTDRKQRTYKADSENYKKGYRLLFDMDIPRNGTFGVEAFELCFACHKYEDLFSPMSNFRDDNNHLYYHELHLDDGFAYYPCWDSDWDGEVDSASSCTACHNVHGSPTPVMIRHGELISSPDTDDKVPALDFRWYEADGSTETSLRDESRYGALLCGAADNDLSYNHVCYGCHATGLIAYNRDIDVVREIAIEEVWTTDLSDNEKTAFEPGEDIRYHVTFAMTDALDGSSHVIARGRALNLAGADWLTKFRRKKTLSEGNYHWSWDKAVPAEATSGSEAEVRITLKMFDAPDGTLFSKHRKGTKFSIEGME